MGKILLFYKYVSIAYPLQMQKWQQRLCSSLGLTGRIIIAHEGMNGTVGGALENIEQYIQALRGHELFADMDMKESEGSAADFPRLAVVIKREIVNLGIDPEQLTAQEGGTHLTPEQAHALMASRPDDLVILDGRNEYESAVGAFENAIKPPIQNFREFPRYIDEHAQALKNKQVLMYCTGGVRCERASAYLLKKGVTQRVYQITGGIHRYVEQYPDGFFKGKNYVFDKRQVVKVSDEILAQCAHCKTPYDFHSNCKNAQCARQLIICPLCIPITSGTCSELCRTRIEQGKTTTRPSLQQKSIPV